MQWLRLNHALTGKAYHGYGYAGNFFICGHVLALSAFPRKKYRNKFFVNLFSLIRLFIVKPVPHAHVQLHWEGKLLTGETDEDGFFRLEWTTGTANEFGWHEVLVELVNATGEVVSASNAFIFIPYLTQYGFISDIDD